jgi:hypothetical protein
MSRPCSILRETIGSKASRPANQRRSLSFLQKMFLSHMSIYKTFSTPSKLLTLHIRSCLCPHPFALVAIMSSKEISIVGWCPIVLSLWLITLELLHRRAESLCHSHSYLVNPGYLGLNIALSVFSFATSVFGMVQENRSYSLGAFQMVWMHVAGLQVSVRPRSYSKD